MRFIHAADLHIDSPLKGLERYEGVPVDEVRDATRAAFRNLIDACLAREIDFLLLAGDLFDGDWKDFNTALFAVTQLRRLKEKGIPVFLVLGNHDRQSDLTPRIPWPENVTVFSESAPATHLLSELGVAIHGQSFAAVAVSENLALAYPRPIDGYFNIGLLHTSATGASGAADHRVYAPCSVQELSAKGYQYWALGHVHTHQVLNAYPHVVYPGNLQARHIREQGAKGAILVEASRGHLQSLSLVPCDVMRWAEVQIVAEANDGRDSLVARFRKEVARVKEEAEGRLLAVRAIFSGQTRAHAELSRLEDAARFTADVRAAAHDVDVRVWVEKVKMNLRPVADLRARGAAHDLMGDLLRATQTLAASPHIEGALAPLLTSLRGTLAGALDDELRFDDPERNRAWVEQAETLLFSLLARDDT